jgi:AcrR family transcriptional regulator
MTAEQARTLRADAAQNADRLIAAAIRVGLGEGKHVPLSTIAAEAGVGVGTLYRRYPNREALLTAMQERAGRILLVEAEDALEHGTSGLDAVRRFLLQTFEHRDELVLPLHGAPTFDGPELTAIRDRMRTVMEAILQRGHDDGSVLPEVGPQTVIRFGALLAQPMTSVAGWDEVAAEQRRIFLRGIAGESAGL